MVRLHFAAAAPRFSGNFKYVSTERASRRVVRMSPRPNSVSSTSPTRTTRRREWLPRLGGTMPA